MTFNWEDYLTLANKLSEETLTSAIQEAQFRSAISRAYYAAFNQAKTFLENTDKILIPRVNIHKYVINQFQNSPDRRRQKIGNRLLVLRTYRNQADYDSTITVRDETCQEALTLAKRIILAFKKIDEMEE
ncbi:HEPN domain-containing protein [Gloeothece verrucosa]|uniref:HEPN domain protein n=1 Tax=Gloeothece verrucosa (strain PCC 7822) TaxID=497965 RepID=E0UM22_GLOV7|nr:HEPN domain-containing protein [Gloeothece verrucosa]ADN18002.1 HEPN domain protein [Gloeothece verrucosa PCC 7822]